MVTSRRTYLQFAMAIGVAVALAASALAQVAPGAAFPPLAADGLAGGPLPDTSGKVVIVDFWASWCAPCKASFPAYSRLQGEFAARGLVVVGISVDESPAAYAAFVARLKPSFATLHDSKHALVALVQVPTMPTSYLVDREGKVRFVHAGFHGDATERELRSEIEGLLGGRAGAP